jgi:hypothetical protein
MTSNGALVLPVGQFFGTFHRVVDHGGAAADAVGPPARVHNVRVLGEIRELDDARFAVWVLMHGVPDRLGDRVWSREAVRDAAAGADVDRLLDGLLADGLAAELTPGSAEAVEFARRHAMRHRMLGLGNTAEEPWLFSIGFYDQPVVRVTREVYDLWDSCELADSLWSACESIALSERQAGNTDPAQTDAAQMLHGFLGTIHHLLAMSVVYLEPRR